MPAKPIVAVIGFGLQFENPMVDRFKLAVAMPVVRPTDLCELGPGPLLHASIRGVGGQQAPAHRVLAPAEVRGRRPGLYHGRSRWMRPLICDDTDQSHVGRMGPILQY